MGNIASGVYLQATIQVTMQVTIQVTMQVVTGCLYRGYWDNLAH
jgi:hypothetical protein